MIERRDHGNTVLFTPVGPDFGVKLKIKNVGQGDATKPFKVGFRRKMPPSTVWKYVPFSHGLAKGQEREIKVKMNVKLGDQVQIIVDHGDDIKESNEGDNIIVRTVS